MTDYSRYVGIPFVAGGESFAGCDCLGIVQLWYRNELAITLARPVHYAPACERFLIAMENYNALGFDMIDKAGPLKMHDVLLLQHCSLPDNFGVVVDDARMLTCGMGMGSVTVPIQRARIVAAFRYSIGGVS